MKKIALLLILVTVFSCSNEKPVDHIILKGKITNIGEGNISIMNGNGKINFPIKVAEDGTFLDTLNIEPGQYIMAYAKARRANLYLEKGYDLTINFDANDSDNTITFSGKGAKENEYVLEKDKLVKAEMGDRRALFLLEEAEFKAKMQDFKVKASNLLKASEKLTENFIAVESRNINYQYLSSIGAYERSHAMFIKDREFKVSPEFLNELEGINYNIEEDYVFSNAYKGLVTSKNGLNARALMETDSLDFYLANMVAATTFENEFIKNSLLYYYATKGMDRADDLDKFYEVYNANSTNEKNNIEVAAIYNKLIKVAKGKPSPTFNYENYEGGKTSLEDLKGKYTYIDVWATWCGPCKTEIPFLKEVEAKYHGKNIQFVSISIDRAKDYEKWRKMIADLNLVGIQLIADKDWKSEFVQDYMIKGIPRFIIIDPAGNIVDSNAPRPSSPELIEIFNELNI